MNIKFRSRSWLLKPAITIIIALLACISFLTGQVLAAGSVRSGAQAVSVRGATIESAVATVPDAEWPSSADDFTDVAQSDWFYPYLDLLVEEELIRGNDDGTYAPDKLLFTDEFLAMALRTMGYTVENAKPYWAQNYIDKAIELDLIDSGEFEAYNQPISREKIAKIIARSMADEPRVASLVSEELVVPVDDMFSDFSQVCEKEYVRAAIELGILAGYEDGTFRPGNFGTRAEAATMVVRMIDPSYRLERYGRVFFNARTDLNEDGIIKKEKAYDFIMEAVKTLKIREDDSGEVTISGYVPPVPDGQFFTYHIRLLNKQGKQLDFLSTASPFEKDHINFPGEFSLPSPASADDIAITFITLCIPKGAPPLDFVGDSAGFFINRNRGNEEESMFFRNEHGSILYYDFALTEGIWG